MNQILPFGTKMKTDDDETGGGVELVKKYILAISCAYPLDEYFATEPGTETVMLRTNRYNRTGEKSTDIEQQMRDLYNNCTSHQKQPCMTELKCRTEPDSLYIS